MAGDDGSRQHRILLNSCVTAVHIPSFTSTWAYERAPTRGGKQSYGSSPLTLGLHNLLRLVVGTRTSCSFPGKRFCSPPGSSWFRSVDSIKLSLLRPPLASASLAFAFTSSHQHASACVSPSGKAKARVFQSRYHVFFPLVSFLPLRPASHKSHLGQSVRCAPAAECACHGGGVGGVHDRHPPSAQQRQRQRQHPIHPRTDFFAVARYSQAAS
jgi:hypothetical protein